MLDDAFHQLWCFVMGQTVGRSEYTNVEALRVDGNFNIHGRLVHLGVSMMKQLRGVESVEEKKCQRKYHQENATSFQKDKREAQGKIEKGTRPMKKGCSLRDTRP